MSLFIPREGFIDDYLKPLDTLKDTINSYINFFKEVQNSIIDAFSGEFGTPPDIVVNLYDKEITVVNWDVIAPYRVYVQSLVIAIVYIRFFWWCLHRVSAVIYHE